MSETVAMLLTEFLLARIAEDEALARAARATGPIYWGDDGWTETLELAEGEGGAHVVTDHCRRHDPARVLAECEAKRRIVEEFSDENMEDLSVEEFRGAYSSGQVVLRALAAVHSDHPDYREEWRP